MSATTLSVSDAKALVRRNLDELDPNGSIMYTDNNGSSSDYGDNSSLDNIIARYLPDAINQVHEAAPASLLEGEEGSAAHIGIEGKVLSFDIAAAQKYLRLVAFQAKDSNIVITEPVAEASPEGRKQQNQYIRGTKDRPRLVQMQGQKDGTTSFKYYTTDVDSSTTTQLGTIERLLIIKRQEYGDAATEYSISFRLRQNIIDLLTARVLEAFNDQRAQNFINKANNFTTI